MSRSVADRDDSEYFSRIYINTYICLFVCLCVLCVCRCVCKYVHVCAFAWHACASL